MLQVLLAGKPVQMMADTGAAYTCVGQPDSRHLPKSQQFVRIVGFSGIKQLTPLSNPVPLHFQGKTIELPVLISEQTPINLLGRDALCKLNCAILCSPDGVIVEASHYQMTLNPEEEVVYWLGNLDGL
ncbi:unnamed protein product [Knipowitschia caucasica]